MRQPSNQAQAVVLGVYPSALHVAWTPPPQADPRPPSSRGRPLIGSLAVDVEPVVFWDGVAPSPADEVARWCEAVGFSEAQGSMPPGTNGPSGTVLAQQILEPLGLSPDVVAFTDAVPWYFASKGQASAVTDRLVPLAAGLGIDPGELPSRPTKRQLVTLATSESRRTTLRQELRDAGAPLIVTLGQEALDSLRGVVDDVESLPRTLTPDGYGRRGHVRIDGADFEVLPLAHPGFHMKTKHAGWITALSQWRADASSPSTDQDAGAQPRDEGEH